MNAFKIVHDRLAALTDKRLARMSLWDKDLNCGCAIGSILPAGMRRGGSAVVACNDSPSATSVGRPYVSVRCCRRWVSARIRCARFKASMTAFNVRRRRLKSATHE